MHFSFARFSRTHQISNNNNSITFHLQISSYLSTQKNGKGNRILLNKIMQLLKYFQSNRWPVKDE
jgi:hypothetical protein